MKTRIEGMVLALIVEDLNKQFKKLDKFNIQDWQDLDLFAEEELSKEEYKRFTRMLTWQITEVLRK